MTYQNVNIYLDKKNAHGRRIFDKTGLSSNNNFFYIICIVGVVLGKKKEIRKDAYILYALSYSKK